MTIKRRGSEVETTISQKKVDFKRAAIRLKENEGIRVRILSAVDYAEYDSHGSFAKGIYTQPCVGEDCPLCKAVKVGGEEYKELSKKPRYIFAMADIDSGEIRFWDASKKQAQSLIAQIKEYKDDLGEFAFNFKRTGTGTSTVYSLNLIPRLKKEDEAKFHQFDDVEVEDSFFDAICMAKSSKFIVKLLKDAGFPVEDHFPADMIEDDVKPVDITGDGTEQF